MKFTLEHDVIIIEQQTFSSAEEVSSWLALLAEQVSLRIVESAFGADRAQWIIELDGIMLVLFFEALSDALWFELMHKNQIDGLNKVITLLARSQFN